MTDAAGPTPARAAGLLGPMEDGSLDPAVWAYAITDLGVEAREFWSSYQTKAERLMNHDRGSERQEDEQAS